MAIAQMVPVLIACKNGLFRTEGPFLFCKTSEKKTGLLLIDIFEGAFNTNKYASLEIEGFFIYVSRYIEKL